MNDLLTLAAEQAPPQMPLPWDLVPPEMLAGGAGLLLLAGALAGAAQRGLPGARRRPVLPLRWRARLRLHPGPGFVGGFERWRSLGLPHARDVAKAARPSLSVADRYRPGGWSRYAVKIGTAWGWPGRRVFADLENVIGVFAQPGRGKSAASGASILEWDGPLVATSIKDEAIKHTIGPRSEQGQVWIWNPEGLGRKFGSNLKWNPVAGCTDPKTAARRAGTMVEAQTARGLSDSDFWNDQVSMVLGGYLHAAALAGYSMADVYTWATGSDNTPLAILRKARGANPASRGDVEHFLEKMADRTQSSVTTTLRRTLMFMRVPEVAAAVSPTEGAEFDIDAFLEATHTLYLVSNGSDSTTQPLFSALLAEIMHVARITAADRGGRLDPPLRLELDELTNTAPVPVDRWASWARGHGIQIRFYVQTWAQLVERYGQLADSLWSCCALLVVYGGTTEVELLERVAKLAGQVEVRDRDTYTYEQKRDGTTTRRRQKNYKDIPVVTAADLRMPRHWAVVLSSDVPPVIVRTPKVWTRRDVHRWKDRIPGGILAPMPAAVPAADPGIKQRLEQERQAPPPRPQAEQAPAAARPQTGQAPAAAQRSPRDAPEVDELARRRQRQLDVRRAAATGTDGAGKAQDQAPPSPPPVPDRAGDQASASAASGPGTGWSGPPPRIQDAVSPAGPPAGPPAPAPSPDPGPEPASGPASQQPVQRRLHPAPWLAPEQGGPRRGRLPELEGDDEPMPWDADAHLRAEPLPPLDEEGK